MTRASARIADFASRDAWLEGNFLEHAASTLLVGDRVRVRRQRWRIAGIMRHDGCALVTLHGQSDSNLGLERQVLTPFERVEPLPGHQRARIVRAVRWRRACRALIASDGPADALQTAAAARMDLLPFQIEPALAIVRGRCCRVLIADEVGLGKTIQAGLIITELRARGAAARVLVLAPAGLREQWADELERRFSLRVPIFDAGEVSRRRAQLPVGLNPWTTEPLVIASLDYVKRPEVLPAVSAGRWDLVVIDEAHHGASGTDRHAALSTLCPAAAYVVLLTATPHSGDAGAFDALCAIGRHDDVLGVFRRTRADVGLATSRRVHQLRVSLSSAERHMYACLAAFERAVQREHRGAGTDTRLATATLRKRALSSAFALERSVRRRLDAMDAPAAQEPPQLALPFEDQDGELDPADALPAWTVPSLRDAARERALLTRLADAATAAAGNESKLSALRRLLRRLHEPVVVFTEYRDTLMHLQAIAAPDASVIHGGMTRAERRAAVARFPHARVLLATDAAGEGLNLHHGCRIVVNLELPWNPVRLEQRIGRVDRIGQSGRVHAFHLIAAGTSETRILRRLETRVAIARTAIGAGDPLSSRVQPVQPAVPVAGRASQNLLRLEADAVGEGHRIALVRSVSQRLSDRTASDAVLPEGPLVAFARRGDVRRRLLGRVLVVFRSTLRDETGRAVASRVTPVLVETDLDARRLREQWAAIGSHVARFLPPASSDSDDSRLVYDAFWSARRDREIAIARWILRAVSREHQPGLFDSRANRLFEAAIEHAGRSQADTDRRLHAIHRFLNVTATPACPVLVLMP